MKKNREDSRLSIHPPSSSGSVSLSGDRHPSAWDETQRVVSESLSPALRGDVGGRGTAGVCGSGAKNERPGVVVVGITSPAPSPSLSRLSCIQSTRLDHLGRRDPWERDKEDPGASNASLENVGVHTSPAPPVTLLLTTALYYRRLGKLRKV